MTIFEYIQSHPNTTSSEIARSMNKNPSSVSGMLSQLYSAVGS